MAHFDDRPAGRQNFAALTSMTDVRDDMVSIFGSDQRVDQTPTDRVQAVRPRHRRRMAITAFLVGGGGLMAAAGIVGGKSVLNAASAGVSKSDSLYSATPFPSSDRRQPATVVPRTEPAPVAASAPGPETGAATYQVALALSSSTSRPHASASRATIIDVADAGTKRVADVAPRRVPIPVSTMARVDVSRPAAVDHGRGPSDSPLAGRPNCSADEGCRDASLRSDDQDVADAYQAATVAGVRPKTLREYRAEWIRARGLASKRPAEAARIYRMIGSDLRLLAADPAMKY